MIIHTLKLQTRYGETDAMGVVYHANYINYYEIARTAMVKSLGNYSYKEMEAEGIMMPVIEVQSKYYKPAYYDDELSIQTTVNELPTAKICFNYKIFNQKNELINSGLVTLAFMNTQTRRPCRPPKRLLDLMRPYFDVTT